MERDTRASLSRLERRAAALWSSVTAADSRIGRLVTQVEGLVVVANDAATRATNAANAANAAATAGAVAGTATLSGNLGAMSARDVDVTFDRLLPAANYAASAELLGGGANVLQGGFVKVDGILNRTRAVCTVRIRNTSASVVSTSGGELHVVAVPRS